jgi:transcriptional regulator with XRE-family HTH domain
VYDRHEGEDMPGRGDYFGKRLQELRREKGLTQPALADAAGVGLSTVRDFEQGRREPTLGTLVKLAQGLGVSLSAFDPPRRRGKGKA